MAETRDRIIEAAVELFNKDGVAATTLRDIAEIVGISSGNLAYHFKNKDFIIEEIYKRMEDERSTMLSSVQQIPSFENANAQALPILKLCLKYRFFYLDTLDILRAYPNIATLHRKYVESHISYIKAMLDYSVGTGNMQPEPFVGCYHQLAETVWMVINFWLAKEAVRGVKKHNIEGARHTMWAIVFPHLTEKGRKKVGTFFNPVAKTI